MPIKIAMTGAGSIEFTRKLMTDILAVPELRDAEFRFHDISVEALDRVTSICQPVIDAHALPAKIIATQDRQEAFTDADFVLCTIRQGGLDAYAHDIEVPLKYGVDQCIGDTLGPGGIFYAQRTIPALLDICRDIKAYAKPDVWFLNYSNPMAMNTWACNKYGGVRTIGLCHGVQGGHIQLTHVVEYYLKSTGRLPMNYVTPGCEPSSKNLGLPDGMVLGMHPREVDIICAGINHQTWFVQVNYQGEDMLPVIREWMPRIPDFARIEKVRLDVLKRFGYYSTESNGHLSEYLPWYRKREDEVAQWVDLSTWIHGESGGYLRHCRERWSDEDIEKLLSETPPAPAQERRSNEHGSWIMESLITGRIYRGHFNVMNTGHITNLPNGCCVEIPGYVDRNGLNCPPVGELPMACAATCSASVRVQQMAMEAAVHGDVNLLKQAMLHDPLTAAVCNPEEVWQMTDDMLIALGEWLPQYRDEIPSARQRLADAEQNGTRVKLRNDFRGSAVKDASLVG